jgi:SAM-dependent methyltransferase
MRFEDNFSAQAEAYAKHRPRYPEPLFEYLAGLVPAHQLAWDCGTGSGQAALGLTPYFDRIVATDASEQQIANALPHERITYHACLAHESRLEPSSVNLITAATALHWFDLEPFYAEVKRVLKPDGVIAAWTYYESVITPDIDRILRTYQYETVGNYWSQRIRWVEEGYKTVPFPFEEISAPHFIMETHWDLNELLGYLHSWSATQKFASERGYSPLEILYDELAHAWDTPDLKRLVQWPLCMKIGC